MRLVIFGFLISCSFSRLAGAGAVVELVPSTPGPYPPNAQITVDIFLKQVPPGPNRALRYVQFDFADTHPALQLDSEIDFDGSSVGVGLVGYAGFPSLEDGNGPVVSEAYTGLDYPNADPFHPLDSPPWSSSMLVLPASGLYRVGSIDVRLPLGIGLYGIDVINNDAPDVNQGAVLAFGFGFHPEDPVTYWHSVAATTANAAPEISGLDYFFVGNDTGSFDFISVPEPTTLLLVALGLWGIFANGIFHRGRI